jgi:hypothetical protein
MKTAVIGSRTFDNYEQLKAVLDNLGDKPTEIKSGGAKMVIKKENGRGQKNSQRKVLLTNFSIFPPPNQVSNQMLPIAVRQ